MNWLVLSYSLPTKASSSKRVTLWRRIQTIGAISPKAGIYILPDTDACMGTFQGLSFEIQQAGGEALVMQVDKFQGFGEDELIQQFHQAQDEEFQKLEEELKTLNREVAEGAVSIEALQRGIKGLQKKADKIRENDFFNAPASQRFETAVQHIMAQHLQPASSTVHPFPKVPQLYADGYQKTVWVFPSVLTPDLTACAWFIRKFIEPHAMFMDESEQNVPKSAVHLGFTPPFVPSEHGPKIFETLVYGFQHPPDPGLLWLMTLLKGMDEGVSHSVPEVSGIFALWKGLNDLSIHPKESLPLWQTLWEGLYRYGCSKAASGPKVISHPANAS